MSSWSLWLFLSKAIFRTGCSSTGHVFLLGQHDNVMNNVSSQFYPCQTGTPPSSHHCSEPTASGRNVRCQFCSRSSTHRSAIPTPQHTPRSQDCATRYTSCAHCPQSHDRRAAAAPRVLTTPVLQGGFCSDCETWLDRPSTVAFGEADWRNGKRGGGRLPR